MTSARHVFKFLFMKYLYLLPILAILFTTSQLDAQVTGFAINGLNLPTTINPASCDSIVSIGFSAVNPSTTTVQSYDLPYVITGNNFNGFQFQTVVNWGDGNTSNSGGGTSTSGTNISMNPPLSHIYNAPGTYLITTTVYNPANQTYAYDSISYSVGACNFYAYTFVGLDCDNNGTIEQTLANVPFELVGNNGQQYNGSPASSNILQFNNVLIGNYTLQISQQWLLANGYQVQSAVPATTFNLPISGLTTFQFTLICAQGVQSLCATGQVYCDANDNGVLDNGETPIANAPVSVNGTLTYSDATGHYYLTYTGNANDTFTLSLNNNWLTQQGYSILNNNGSNINYITGTPCNSGIPPATINFPLNCGGYVSPTLCYGGFVFCDANANGVMNPGESPLIGAAVQLFVQPNSNTSVTVYTDSTGYFTYCGPFNSTSTIILAQVSPIWLTYNGYSVPSSYVTLQGFTSPQLQPGMLPINCGGTTSCADLWTSVTPWIGYYQNSVAYIKLNWGSYGPSATGNYTLSMTFPVGVSPILASIQNPNYTISGNTITWNLSSSSSNFMNYDVIQFNVPGGLINGAQHYFSSSIAPTGSISDCGTYNNAGNLLQILGNSYDPNDKNASTDYQNDNFPLGYLDAFVDDALTYTIRFQNTGTAPAQNIYIIDTLDAALDWNSFTLIEASHNMQVVNLGNGIYRFEFPQIWLPDSTTNEEQSHGHLTYRITELPNNPINSTIENTAYIYFDWNSPIITNTTFNINMWIDGINELENQLVVYPNPATDEIMVSLEQPTNARVTDLNGKLLLERVLQPGDALDLESLNAGIYMIEAGSKRTKLIKN
ncbi:MAG: hypothetical protein RL164_1455 [Bacteroidota bacterium]|jgi:uncharacterized repeat protein (TIGR01451 family)